MPTGVRCEIQLLSQMVVVPLESAPLLQVAMRALQRPVHGMDARMPPGPVRDPAPEPERLRAPRGGA
eukprot:12237816-Alexandrium_andersonii.AAC.1